MITPFEKINKCYHADILREFFIRGYNMGQEQAERSQTGHQTYIDLLPSCPLKLEGTPSHLDTTSTLVQASSTRSIRPIRGHYKYLPMLKNNLKTTDCTSHMHNTYHADNQVTDDKDQCDGKVADSRRKSMHSTVTSWESDRV